MSEIQKVPLYVEIIGEQSVGKTHLSCLFPQPALMDTTPKGEARTVLKKLHSDWKNRYWRIRNFDDLRKALKQMKSENFKTVIVDTSANLRDLGSKEYLVELNKSGKERQALMPQEYRWVNERINGFIDEITDPTRLCMNLVFTSQMKDEWQGNKSTGKRIRKGYPDANFQSDIRFYLQVTQKVDLATMQYINEYERKCTIIKNRFRDQVNKEDWIQELKELTWDNIKKLTKLAVEEIVE